ncbi:hypothetical protein BIY26_00535 [Brenneria goodwinii]|uniref:Uncharacterized protein n=1 Tax=Brenneria goodwinii TaxID=1109412 RepID=A0AAE8ES81_9GAMM|nr:hypothetical protein AWC36_09425 [Brenneria goodwinii]RLM29542.1 hypothetical protein BIY26_00535 [Brenneria goodwinii]
MALQRNVGQAYRLTYNGRAAIQIYDMPIRGLFTSRSRKASASAFSSVKNFILLKDTQRDAHH